MSETGSGAPLEVFASRWMVALFALIGLIIGLVIFGLRDPVYEATSRISVVNPIGTMGDEAALITSDRVLSPAAASLGFIPDIEVEPNEIAELLTVTARADNPDGAAQAANTVSEIYVQSQTSVAVRVTNVAEPNADPVSPNRLAHVLIGSLLGAIIGAVVNSGRAVRRAIPTRSRPEPAERPAPIRPAVAPSAELHAFADPESTLDVESFDDDLEWDGDTQVYESGGDRQLDNALGRGDRRVDAVKSVNSVNSVNSVEAVDVVDVRGAAPSSAFSNAASSMVASPPPPPGSSWRSGDEELVGQTPEPTGALPPIVDPDVPRSFADVLPPIAPPQVASAPAAEPDAATGDRPRPRATRPEPAQAIAANVPEAPETTAVDHSRTAANPGHVSESYADSTSAVADTELPPTPTTHHAEPLPELEDVEARYETALNDQAMAHAETLSSVEADFERENAELKRQLADARKQGRLASAQLKRLSGDDQHRIGDLEAQAEALEAEITTLRTQLESERIDHLRELTTERDAADRALDNARREFRENLELAATQNRRTLTDNRTDLDELLAQARAEHQVALDTQHQEYDETLVRERERHKSDLARLVERNRDELARLKNHTIAEAKRRLNATKDTITELRAAERRLNQEVEELRQAERQYRGELSTARKQNRYDQQQNAETEQSLRDELAVTKKSLATEKERNAALREDVVRRTAEAHHAIDRNIDDRSAQLAELEAVVAKQRQHAEDRVREATEAAEERARESARREAELAARITRLERELDQVRRQTG